jgi:FSR family fosmidomycin resistance protein-like MFS transporter
VSRQPFSFFEKELSHRRSAHGDRPGFTELKLNVTSLDTTLRSEEAADVRRGMFTLIVLTALHFVVDTIASQITPLWPTLEWHYHLPTFWMLFIWTLAGSFSQLGFALIGDRTASRWLVWCGPAVSCICLGCLGLFEHFLALAVLLAIAGMGIAAFHPEGATLSGNCWPHARSRALSIFAMGGFLGQSVGPPCSGWIVDHFGLSALSRGIAIGLALIFSLRLVYRPMIAPARNHATASSGGWAVLKTRQSVLLMLLMAGTVRVIATAGVPITLAYWLKSLRFSDGEIGAVQSPYLAGIGLGGLLAAIFVRSQRERLTLWLVPLFCVPCLLAMPSLQGFALSAASGATGLFLGIAQPVFVSYGQQLFPESQRVASSITMGVSWGAGGAIVAGLIDVCSRRQSYDLTFVAFAVAVMLSSVLCVLLPRVRS